MSDNLDLEEGGFGKTEVYIDEQNEMVRWCGGGGRG